MQLLLRRHKPLILRTIGIQQRLISGNRIHYLQLKIRVLNQQIRVLRVDIYQPVCQDFQLLQGHDAVIHKRPTFAVGV